MSFVTSIYTRFCGICVGQDSLGNKYYKGKAKRGLNLEKRWVLYKQDSDLIANLDPLWFKWLHYMTNEPPVKSYKKAWMLTGGTTEYDRRALYDLHDRKRKVKLWKYIKKDAKREN